MRRITRIVATDHHHQIERLRDQVEHGILPLLRGGTDRVERPEMLADRFGPPTSRHALPHFTGDRERLSREHRRLVRDTDPLQVVVGIEAGGHLARELLQKHLTHPPSLDILTDDPCLVHITYDDVFPTRILVDLARRGLRLFVVVLAVDQGGEAVARVHFDALPNVQYRSAGRVDKKAADGALQLEVPQRHAKLRANHDVSVALVAVYELT